MLGELVGFCLSVVSKFSLWGNRVGRGGLRMSPVILCGGLKQVVIKFIPRACLQSKMSFYAPLEDISKKLQNPRMDE